MYFIAFKDHLIIPGVDEALQLVGEWPGCGLVQLAVLLVYPIVFLVFVAAPLQVACLYIFGSCEWVLTKAGSSIRGIGSKRQMGLSPLTLPAPTYPRVPPLP